MVKFENTQIGVIFININIQYRNEVKYCDSINNYLSLLWIIGNSCQGHTNLAENMRNRWYIVYIDCCDIVCYAK